MKNLQPGKNLGLTVVRALWSYSVLFVYSFTLKKKIKQIASDKKKRFIVLNSYTSKIMKEFNVMIKNLYIYC